MAGVLRHWRESATLLLISKRLPPVQPKESVLNKVFKKTPESTAVGSEESLRLLLMKRSGNSKFMPNIYVFPGGMLDNSDFSKDWVDFLQLTNETHHFFNKGTHGTPIFSRQRDSEFSNVVSEVALRIAAIRETFEESGILLGRPISEVKTSRLAFNDSHPLSSSVHPISDDNVLTEWRKKISNDSNEFLSMCKEMEVVPDIWSLYEWANWMSPLLRSTRFDTAFFIGCVDEAPQISINSGEMDNGLWVTPSSMVKSYLTKAVTLAPPQLYELLRLSRFASVDDLLAFASKRSEQRVDRWMPVLYKCADGMVFALPGDDLYPDDPDLTGERTDKFLLKSETFAELQKKYPYQHRAFLSDKDKIITLYCNLEFTDGHILPLSMYALEDHADNWR